MKFIGAARKVSTIALMLASLLYGSVAAAQKRGFQPDDVYRLTSVADPQVAPDGSAAPAKLTNFKDGVARFSWSPDGAKLACVVKALPEDQPHNSDTKHYASMSYKADGVGWSDGRHNHIWIVDTKSGKATQ